MKFQTTHVEKLKDKSTILTTKLMFTQKQEKKNITNKMFGTSKL